MGSSVRVLQASDFQLHQPLVSAGVLPSDLREIFNQARERSALKVFQKAVTESVDLLLLTGPLACVQEEPRLGCFLYEQFRRLKAEGIHVVWAARRDEALPDWSVDQCAQRLHPGESITIPTTRSRQSIFVTWTDASKARTRSPANSLTVAIQKFAQGYGVEYSLAGEVTAVRHRLLPIQTAGPNDSSIGGMWLTKSDSTIVSKPTLVPSATVCWATETIELQPDTSHDSLLAEMDRRIRDLTNRQTVELLLVQWQLTGHGPLWQSLLKDPELHDLLQAARGLSTPQQRTWTWKIDAVTSDQQLEHWRRSSQAFAEALRQRDLMSETEVTSATSARFLPGNEETIGHSASSIPGPHSLRIHLARATQFLNAESSTENSR